MKRVFVVAESVGWMGGAARSTLLLCERATTLADEVRLFVTRPAEGDVQDRLRTARVKVTVPLVGRGYRFELPQLQTALLTELAAWRTPPPLVHCVSLGSEARALLSLPPVAPVWLWETTEALPHVKFVDRRITGVIGRAAGMFAPSSAIAANVRTTYGFDGPVRILPFWVDAPAESVAPDDRRSRRLLFVGRLDPDKGFSWLFAAFRAVKRRHSETTLEIHGPGDRAAIQQLAHDIDGIEIGGPLVDRDLEDAFARCDALVLPSLHEGYPLVLLEACARGRPIITTTVGAVPELFAGHACAELVPPRDETALAAAMERLLYDSDVHHAERCRDARRRFDELSGTASVDAALARAYEGLLVG